MPEKHGKYICRDFPMDNVWTNLVPHTKSSFYFYVNPCNYLLKNVNFSVKTSNE